MPNQYTAPHLFFIPKNLPVLVVTLMKVTGKKPSLLLDPHCSCAYSDLHLIA